MDSARTVWAEGYGFSVEQVEALTVIAEDATRRCRTSDVHCGTQPDLMTSDLSQWAAELERFGFEDLASQVQNIDDSLFTDPPNTPNNSAQLSV